MGLPAKDDREVEELRERLGRLSDERQARVIQGFLTPGVRLRALAEQVRANLPDLSDEDEAAEAREIHDAVKEVRRKLVGGG